MTVEITRLTNGLTIVTDRIDRVESVSVGLWVGAGTRNEMAAENGVAHLLEHMVFKGTRRRSARAIAEEIEAVGGHLNAYTGRENTAYYAKVLKEDMPLAVDLIADILRDSLFDEDELARERAVVLQEIGQAEDTPDDIIFDHFQATAYPAQPLGLPVLGDPAVVGAMPRDALIGYQTRYYTPGRMVLAAAGNLDHAALVALAERYFGDLPSHDPGETAPSAYAGGDWRDVRELEQAHLLFGWPSVPIADPLNYAAALYSAILGGGMSSRLFQKVREEKGLVYSIYSFNAPFLDSGLMGIYAGTGAAELAELTPIVLDEVKAMADGVTEAELTRAKAQLRASVLMGLESPTGRCEQIAQQILIHGRVLPVSEIREKIEAVDRAALRDFAAALAGQPMTCAAMGPVADLAPIGAMQARLSPAPAPALH